MSDRKGARETDKPKDKNERYILHVFGAKQPKTSQSTSVYSNEPIGESSMDGER